MPPLTPEQKQQIAERSHHVPGAWVRKDILLLLAEIERLEKWNEPCPSCRGEEGHESCGPAGWVAAPCTCHPARQENMRLHGDIEVYVHEADEFGRDARRWWYVRDNLAFVVESMAGDPVTHAFQFRMPRSRGTSIEQVIDRCIEKS